MIEAIINAVKPRLMGLKYIERYGGLVMPVTTIVEGEDGSRSQITFPVSCDAEGKTCYLNNDYYDLAPNDNYRSVAYWEVTNSVSRQSARHGSRRVNTQYTQNARFVAWLNLQNLGYDSACDLMTRIVANTINAIEGRMGIIPNTPLANVKIRLVGQAPKSMDIFRAYSYSDKTELMLYPYDFFALDFQFLWMLRKDCIIEEGIYEEICPPESQLVKLYGGFSSGFSNGFDTVQNA